MCGPRDLLAQLSAGSMAGTWPLYCAGERGNCTCQGRIRCRETRYRYIADRLNSWQSAGDRRLWKIIISPEFGELSIYAADAGSIESSGGRLGNFARMGCRRALQYRTSARSRCPEGNRAGPAGGSAAARIREDRNSRCGRGPCTRQLGHRTDRDAAEAERREVQGKRFTSLDRTILRSAEAVPGTLFSTVTMPPSGRKSTESDFVWTRRQHMISRLGFLEDMGLARSVAPGTWTLRSDIESVLRAMQRAGDRQKVLAAHGALLSDERLPMTALEVQRMGSSKAESWYTERTNNPGATI